MSKKLFALLLGAAALVSSVFGQLQSGSPWPKFQVDASNSGQGVGGGSNGGLRWQTDVSDNFTGSPVIDANGILYAAGKSGNVYAYNSSGTIIWTCPTGDHYVGSPAIGSDGTLYVAGTAGGVFGISSGVSGGSILWIYSTGDGFRGGVAIGPDGTLYVGGTSGTIYALTSGASGGGSLWAVPGPGGSIDGTPAVGSDSTLYVATSTGIVAAFSGGSTGGTQVVSYSTGDAFYECPSITANSTISSGATLYVAGTSGTVYQIVATSSGASIGWSKHVPAPDQFTCSPAVGSDGTIYVAGTQGDIYAFDYLGFGPVGDILWSVNEPGEVFQGSVVIGGDGTIYAEGKSGRVYALAGGPSSGAQVWTTPIPTDSFYGSPAIGADGTVYVEGFDGGVHGLGTVQEITGITLNSTTAIGGIYVVATVTTQFPATGLGWSANLNYSSPYVTGPAFVTVQPGQTTASFQINTTQPPSPVNCTITATDPVTSRTATLSVLGDYVTGLTLNPASIGGGDTSTGTVTLYQPAPSDGYVVNLSTQYPNSVGVPATVTVQPGETQATFTITTKQFGNIFNCDIYATDGFSGAQVTLQVVGDSISMLTLSPVSIGCNQTSTGTVTLTTAAPSAGWVVNISDEYPGSVSVPTTVRVPAGQLSATFTVTPLKQFSNTFQCDIYVSDGHSAKQAPLMVMGDSIASVSFPTSVVGGATATGTVTLTSMAPPGGWVVNLSTEYPSVDGVQPIVTVPAGSLTATFTVTTKATATTYGCDVYASDGVSGKQTMLTITHS